MTDSTGRPIADHSTSADPAAAPSVDAAEAARFERLAEQWWDAGGPFWPLHRLNAVRLGFIRRHLTEYFPNTPLEQLQALDIGCGGGILSESLARLDMQVTGIDVVARNLAIARRHSQAGSLTIDYRSASAEQLERSGEQFDVVLTMEVVEHVHDAAAFLGVCGQLVRPGGLLFVATINRTWAAALIAIFGAEYLLGWLPRGTHQYHRLVRPREVRAALGSGWRLRSGSGVRINPFTRRMGLTRWLGVNYMLCFESTGLSGSAPLEPTTRPVP